MQETIKKHSFKIQVGTAVTVILFIIGTTWSMASTQAKYELEFRTMENQYNHCNKWYVALEERMVALEKEDRDQDLILVEVRTKLNNIESMLLDIKEKIE